jgi:HAD superfamily hydrolase (TIGR01490 family)
VADFCAFYVGTLAGRSVAQWQPLCRQFLQEDIVPRLGPQAHALVARHQDAGDTVVLTTATNRVITTLTAAHLGIEHLIATECETTADGMLTGKVSGKPNMREGKVARLQAWLAERGADLASCHSTFYSDSMNDLPLLLAVQQPVVVNADAALAAQAQQRGWPSLRLYG